MPGLGVRRPAGTDEEPALRETTRQRLAETRSRTLAVVDATSETQLDGQPEPTTGVPARDVGREDCFERARGGR